MSPAPDLSECVERLLRGFRTYDRAVDVVSSFEMLFTTSKTEVPGTVRHFERFPRVPDGTGNPLTPDFSVVFEDGGGLVGEIARIAQHENSIEKPCSQIGKYDGLRQLPGPNGLIDVTHVDVLLVVPNADGIAAVKRVVVQRYADPKHSYSPAVPPCVIQFGFDEGKYTFQRIPDPRNGELRDGARADGLGAWFEDHDINVKPGRFADIKADRAFINDPADPLYLATHLWSKTFATMASDTPVQCSSNSKRATSPRVSEKRSAG